MLSLLRLTPGLRSTLEQTAKSCLILTFYYPTIKKTQKLSSYVNGIRVRDFTAT